MTRFTRLALIALLVVLSFAAALPTVQAQPQYYYSFTGFNGTCGGSAGAVFISGSIPRTAYVPANNEVFWMGTNVPPPTSGSFVLPAQGPASPGTFISFTSNTGPEPVDISFEATLHIGGVPTWVTRIRVRCTGPGATPTILELFAGPYSTPLTFSGPPLPEGFVLRTITCDVAVFDSPGGTPVGDNRIIAGQTWYVNPTPVKAPSGEDWTEIFVSGTPNGFIPTRCVG